MLCFIQNQVFETELADLFRIPFDQRIRTDADIVEQCLFPQFRTIRTGDGKNFQRRRKFFRFAHPVFQQTGRTYHQCGQISSRFRRQQGNGLHRFAQPHFVCQNQIVAARPQ